MIWAFILQTQQNPYGILQFMGDTKSETNTFVYMLVSLILLGVSQSLITLGCHTYLIKGVRVASGETEDYPFTINSLYTLSRVKSQGMFLGAIIGSIGFTCYMQYGSGIEEVQINILDISYRQQVIFQYYTLFGLIPWTFIYFVGQLIRQVRKQFPGGKEDDDEDEYFEQRNMLSLDTAINN